MADELNTSCFTPPGDATTGEDGRYEIAHLASGRYALVAEHEPRHVGVALEDELKAKTLALISGQMANWVVEIQRSIADHQANLVRMLDELQENVARYDERWIYRDTYRRSTHTSIPNALPNDLPYVIVIGKSMDYGLTETVPSALAGAATGLAYSRDTIALVALAQYLRNLGFRAEASMNDSALAIPLAIQAGLGEYGRHGLLITPEFGPRLRLGKVFTDAPLIPDRPRSFGVKQFCDQCQRCARACPVKAIPFDPPSSQVYDRSNLVGVTKWTVNAAKCFGFWVNQNTDCSICIRVCPFNRDYSKWYHRLWRTLAATPLRGLLVRMEEWSGRGKRRPAGWWWSKARS